MKVEIKEIAKELENKGVINLRDLKVHLDSWFKHYERVILILKRLKKEYPGGFLGDIGIGFAPLALAASRMGFKVIATEHPTAMRKSVVKLARECGIDLVSNDLKDGLPFKDSSFDIILFCDVIEHLEGETVLKSLGEISRCLKKGGKVVVTTPNLSRLSNVIRLALGKSINPPVVPERFGGVYGHVREFSPREMKDLLKGVDLYTESMDFAPMRDFVCASRGWIKDLFYSIGKLLPSFTPWGDEMYIVAVKQ